MKNLKLGLRPRKFHFNTLCLHDYLKDEFLADPGPQDLTPAVTASIGTDWGMDGNDSVGDCACAMESHRKMIDSANVGSIIIPTTEDTLALYSAVTGYDPSQTDSSGNNPTDQGTVLTDLFSYLEKNGTILAWAEFDPTQFIRYRQAINIFGSALVGVQIRQSDMDEFNSGNSWSPQTDAVEGGHAIIAPKADLESITYVTWGALQQATQDWCLQETSEAYVVISQDFINTVTQNTPSGFNLAQLQHDLTLIKSNK